ncbi:hypothetical protein [Dyadobacter sp. BHUBP1]|uniref:hypothetical protein n=1 Tax=Dyadobacter sp. BHUBP1 TaxID=3424178 RepID=UPI003D3276A4
MNKSAFVLSLCVLCSVVLVVSCQESDIESGTPKGNAKANSDANLRLDLPGAMVGMDWAQKSSDNFYYWTGNGTARFGTYNDTDPSSSYTYTYTNGGLATVNNYPVEIAEIAIGLEPGTTVNRVYTYFYNSTFAEGISNDLDFYTYGVPYVCATGKTPNDIVGIAINSINHTYAWYKDGTASRGTKTNLGAFATPYPYSLPPGKSTIDIIGMAIDKANSDKVYTWYYDGTVSIGTSSDLDYYAAPVPFD